MSSALHSGGPQVIRFGAYEVDVRTGELRKHGLRIKLQDQPFQILVMLLEKPGELVTREEIQAKLWPGDTFVDFDHSVNTAIRRLRDALSDSADNPRFVETLPRRGYRFIGQVEAAGTEPATAGTPSVEVIEKQVVRYRRREAIWGMVIVAVITASLLVWRYRPQPAGIDSLAVLPFTNGTKNADLDFLGDGIAESITANLSQVPTLKVMSRNSAFRYRGSNLDSKKVAGELGVRALLLGTVQQHGDDLRVSLELVDARDQRQIWATDYDRKLADMYALQEEISRETVHRLKGTLSGTPAAGGFAKHKVDPSAYELYLRGRHALEGRRNPDIQRGLEYFQKAVDADPSYADAYVGMSAAYGLLSFYGGMAPLVAQPREEAAARRALELDPEAASSHVQMAFVMGERRDLAAAEQEWKRALEMDPNSAEGHHGYSMLLTDEQRFDEALRECAITEKLDPLWQGSSGSTAWTLLYARRYDESEKKALAYGTGFGPSYWVLGQIYESRRDYKRAIEAFETVYKAGGNNDFSGAMLAHAYAKAGRRADAQRLLAELLNLHATTYFSPFHIAAVYVALGNKAEAIRWLKTADKERDPWLARLAVESEFDEIRNDPEVKAIQRSAVTPIS